MEITLSIGVDFIMFKNKYYMLTFVSLVLMCIVMFTPYPSYCVLFALLAFMFGYQGTKASHIEKQQYREDKIIKLNKLLSNKGIIKSQFYVDEDAKSGLVLDEKHKTISIIGENLKITTLPYSSIVESELVQDEVSVTKVNSSSLVGRSIIGGLAFGEVGSVVGAVTSNKTSHKEVKNIRLSLTVNNLDKPVHQIHFLNSKKPLKVNDIEYQEKYNNAYNWHKIFAIIIQRENQKVNNN